MKKLLTLVVCSLLAIWTVNAGQYTMSGTFKNGGTWKVEKGVLYVDAETIPNSPNTRPAARINLAGGQSNAWENMSPWWGSSNSIRTIELSSKVRKIGYGAFAGCVNLEKVVFKAGNNNNVEIGDEAFSDCWRLTDFDFSRVSVIGENAFDRCRSLKRIELPVILSIGRNAFCECASLWLEDGGIVLSGNTIPSGLNNMVVTQNPYGAVSSPDANGKLVRILTLSGRLKVIVPPAKLPSYISTYAKSYTWGLIFLGGDGWEWYFDDSRTGMEKLYIFADGYYHDGIPDFESETDQPWYLFRNKIRWVEIDDIHPYGCTIGKNAFKGCSIESLDIFASTFISWINIGESAFDGCSRFTGINIMAEIKTIGKKAFANTSLRKIDLSKASTIDDYAFDGCSINNITFGSISSIGQNAFRGAFANGGDIYVSTSVPTTASNAFSGAKTASTTLHVSGDLLGGYMATAPWSSFQLDQSKIFPVSGTWGVGYGTWIIDQSGTLIVKKGTNGFDTRLPDYANESDQPWYIYRDFIKKIEIEEGLQGIGKNAFATPTEGESQVTEVVVPATVTEIGENAFKNNDQLVEVQAEGVQTIASQAFENCSSLEKVNLGKDVKSLGTKVFNNCGLVDVMAVKAATPPAVTVQTFMGMGVISSNAPAKVKAKYAARRATSDTGQKAVNLDVPEDYIAKYLAAQYWNLFSFEYIGEHGGIVRSGQYYDGVWVIYEDGTLIASSETSTGTIDGFYNQPGVKRVELMGGATELNWTGFGPADLPNLEEVVLSPAMHKLGNEVFKNSTKLKSINLENVDSIGQNCFKGCTSLTSVNLPTIKYLANNAFENCTSLATATVSGNSFYMSYQVFKGCTALKSIDLSGMSINSVPTGAFSGCTALEHVKMDGTALSVSSSMFSGCSALSVVELGSDCRYVYANAFANTGLDSIFSASPTPAALDATAFTGLTLADITASVPADYVRIYKKADVWKDMNIVADATYGEPMLPTGGMMNSNAGTVFWTLEQDGTMTFSGEGGCSTTGEAMALHHQYAVYMENIIYSDEITEIGSDITSQYDNYAYVKTVEIGADVKHIYANAMLYPHVTDVYCFAADVPALNANAFNKAALIANDATLHVVDFTGTLAKYQASSSWNWFPHIVADLPTRKPGTIKVTKVIVDPNTRNMPLTTDELGSKTIQLTAVVYPANATNQEVKWSTSDASVATVDQNGLVTIVGFDESGEGVTITATAKDGSNKKGSCTMSVWDSSYPDEIPATGIDVNRKSLTLMKSEEGVVRVSLTPANSNAWVDGSFVTLGDTPATINVMPVNDPESGQRTGEFTITPMELGSFEVTFTVRNMDATEYSTSMTVNVVEDVFFTENTKEGVPVTYRLIKTDDKLVEVYGDEEQKITVDPNTGIPSVEYIYHTAVDPSTAGTITIPSVVRGCYNVVGTGEIAFRNCTQLERVDFCPGIQYVGDRAFEGCTSLNEVRLPASLKGLGINSFAMLTTLKNVHLMATTAPEGLNGSDIWGTSAFMGLSEGEDGATLHVAQGCYSVYNVSPWIEWFTSIVEDGEAVDNYIVSYTCDFTTAASKHSNYNDTWTYDTDWSVFGGANNNGGWAYAKFGGRSTTLANANPVYVANQYAFGREIKAIRVTFPSGSFSKGGMSCNDWGVKVYSDLACTDLLYTVTGEAIAANGCTLTLTPEAGQVWKAGYGFRVYWNLANTSSTNGIVLVDKIEYLTDAEDSRAVWPMYTVRFLDWNGSVLQEGEIREGFMPAYAGETPVRPMDTEYIYTFTGWDPALVAATADADYTAQYSTEERFPGGGTGIEEIFTRPDAPAAVKILHNGTLYILRPDGAIFDVRGVRVK